MDKRVVIASVVGASVTLAFVLILLMGVFLVKILRTPQRPSESALAAPQPAPPQAYPPPAVPAYQPASFPLPGVQSPTAPPARPPQQAVAQPWQAAADAHQAAARRNQLPRRDAGQGQAQRPRQPWPPPAAQPPQPPANVPPPLLHPGNMPNTAWRVQVPDYGAARVEFQPNNQLRAKLEGMPIETTGTWRVEGDKLHISANAPPEAAAFNVTGPVNLTCDIRGDQIFYNGVAITRLPQ